MWIYTSYRDISGLPDESAKHSGRAEDFFVAVVCHDSSRISSCILWNDKFPFIMEIITD
jgi:hypothetical protein